MTPEAILDRVSTIVGETVGLTGLALKPDMTAADVEGWDSLANVQIIVAVEHAFKIRFRTGEIATIGNVGELVKRIASRAGSPESVTVPPFRR